MINLSTSAYFERATRQMGDLRSRANKMQEQISTGDRLTRSSDDPVAAARLRTLSRTQTLSDIDKTNSDRAAADLKLADSALSSVAEIITRAKELTIQAANGIYGETERATIGMELENLQKSLLLVMNGENSAGHALFGGQTSGDSYELQGGSYAYVGTAQTTPLDLGEGQDVIPGVTGPEVLEFEVNGSTTDLFAVLGNLAAVLQDSSQDGTSAANAALDSLDAGLQKVTTAQTVIGARMNWVDLMDTRRIEASELNADEKATVGGADIAETTARLQEMLTVLEASQASFVRLANLSLFNMI
ncbi:flagellar hook-associated protein 3 FlgL [Altererythrobacter atlanticus]|uniref:Flagellar hook-associated protein 3 n=1 Tax=Croceibacterium atlanticum TaxID=1267766 RepID=A0A0F7KWX5_9SPHN|nr:flagellar hook protein FlgL [Croceibacterium atlanticum]AKH44174.1 Flagellar hook-associated protein 3 [Croceibacterium atlanticum]MBB5732485.1 flagellar hook-associated protein 3 FlgL [Croceibacterium atlanticum]